jgi:hypothetical protein
LPHLKSRHCTAAIYAEAVRVIGKTMVQHEAVMGGEGFGQEPPPLRQVDAKGDSPRGGAVVVAVASGLLPRSFCRRLLHVAQRAEALQEVRARAVRCNSPKARE